MSKTTRYKLKMHEIFCTAAECENKLKIPVHEANSLTMAGVYQRHKWFVTESWNGSDFGKGLSEWDGYAYCPDHEDEANKRAYSEDN